MENSRITPSRRMMLFSEARWSQRVSWSGWFPLKSSRTCSCCRLHCDLQNVPREHANRTAGMYVLTVPRHLANWLDDLDCVVSLTALRRTQVKTLLATIHELLRLLVTMESPVYRAVTWIPICVRVTWLPKFLSCGSFPWEAPSEDWKGIGQPTYEKVIEEFFWISLFRS
jgi:hypothetical protein